MWILFFLNILPFVVVRKLMEFQFFIRVWRWKAMKGCTSSIHHCILDIYFVTIRISTKYDNVFFYRGRANPLSNVPSNWGSLGPPPLLPSAGSAELTVDTCRSNRTTDRCGRSGGLAGGGPIPLIHDASRVGVCISHSAAVAVMRSQK